MPSTLPGLSVTQAQQLLQVQDRLIKQFPEVERVFGKAGRAETSTDPAPFSMMETVIMLKPHDQWRRVPTWYSRLGARSGSRPSCGASPATTSRPSSWSAR